MSIDFSKTCGNLQRLSKLFLHNFSRFLKICQRFAKNRQKLFKKSLKILGCFHQFENICDDFQNTSKDFSKIKQNCCIITCSTECCIIKRVGYFTRQRPFFIVNRFSLTVE